MGLESMRDAPAIVVLTRAHYPFSNILLGFGIYLIGLSMSLLYNAVGYFLQTVYFAIGCFGIVWVSSMWTWAFRSLEAIMKELESSFKMNKSSFHSHAQRFIELISSDRRALLFSIPGFIFVAYHIWLIFTEQISLPVEVPTSIQGNLVFGSYAIVLFSICMYFVFASAHILILALLFLTRLTKSPIKISLLQVRRKVGLEKATDTILTATIGWFVGVSLVMTVLFAYSSTIILAFLVFVTAIGLSFFFIPQILFHNAIYRSKESLLRKIESEFIAKTKLPLSPECNAMQSLLLCMLFEQVDKISEWPMNTSTLFHLFSSLIIPVATAFTGILLK